MSAETAAPSSGNAPPGLSRWLLVAFALLLIGLLAGGVSFHGIERRRLRATAANELEIIGRLKADEIAAWRADCVGDASVLMENRFLGDGVAAFLSSPRPDRQRRISSLFRSLQRYDGYDDVLLADTNGRVRWSVSGTTSPLHDTAAADLRRALTARRAVLGDLHSGPGSLPPHLDLIAPLFAGDPARTEPVAAVVLRTHADRFLFPLITVWPTPSRSAETLLIRRDGADALFLNELRHRKGTALQLRNPLTSTDLPAAMAVLGRRGVVEGLDYRGVPVLAALTAVPDSPWLLVAKVDAAEALAASRSLAVVTGGLLGLVATTTLVGFLALWQRASRSHYQRLYEAETGLAESEGRFRTMFELASIGIAQADPATGRWLRVNQKLCDITGYSAEELLALQIPDITHPADRQADREAFQRVVRGEAPAYRMEKRYLRKDGGEVWVNVNMTVIRDAEGRPVRTMAAIEDISDRKRAEQALSESEAFTRVVLDNLPVGIAVNSVDPAVTFSYVNDNFLKFYRTTRDRLAGVDTFWEAVYEDPQLRAPLKKRVLDDCASGDPERMRWEDVPIARHGEETTFISARNIPVPGKPLMISTVWDVTERKRAEQSLSASETRYRRLFESAKDGILILDADTGMILDVNPYLTEMLGLSHGLVLQSAIWDIGFFKDVVANRAKFLELQQKDFVRYEHLPLETASGQRIDVEFVSNVYLVNDRRVIQCNIRDITERRRAEAALHQAHERLRRFVDSNVVGVVIADAAGGIHEANDYYLRLVGLSRDELQSGQVDWRALTPPEWLPADERALRELRERGTCTPYEKEYLHRDGTRIPVLLADALLPGPEEEIAAFALDLTELKRAERALRESEERYRTVAEFTHDWEYWRAPDGRLLYVSPSCERITGYPASAFLGDSGLIDRIVHPDDRATLEAHHAKATERRDSRLSLDFRILRRDGSLVWMNHSCIPVFDQDGGTLGRRGSNRDISDRKRIEDEIRRLNEELEERVRQRTAQLEAANKELEAFSYSVSHDLRAPLRGIDGWSQALLEDYGNTLDDQATQYLHRIRADAQRMGHLIDDMLRLARVTRATITSEAVDLSALAQAILGRLRAASPERLVETAIQPGVTAHGDAGLLEVLMANLLDNAWKFSAPRRPAHIAFGAARRDGEQVFFVRDDGVGFDMAYAGKLFGVFQRMHKASEFPGTGVGLATVQRIVQRHGGRVWVQAEPDRGAAFSFTLSEADP